MEASRDSVGGSESNPQSNASLWHRADVPHAHPEDKVLIPMGQRMV